MSRAHIVMATPCAWIALAISTSACAADKPAQPQTRQQQEQARRAIARLLDFWQGTWQSIGAIADDFPVSPEYTPAALE